jgi:hypothetical protein
MTANEQPSTRAEWLTFFRQHYSNIRPLVCFLGGSRLGNQLDKFKDVSDMESTAVYSALTDILHKAIADVVVSDVDYMTGWHELVVLCRAHVALPRHGKAADGKEKATKAGYCKV